MGKIKIGYLPLYIKLYDDTGASRRDPLVAYMRTLISMIASQGIEVVEAPVCRVRPEFEAAIDLFKSCDVDAIVTQHLAYSPSLESIDALERAGVPLIVLDTTPDYSLIETSGWLRGVAANHGIHGVQDMCNLLRRRGIEYYLCVGHAMHSDVIAQVASLCRAAAAAKAYKTARVGSVGGSFAGMGDFLVSDAEYKAKIGADVVYLDKAEAEGYMARVTDEDIQAEIKADRAAFTCEVADEEGYIEAVRSGLAVRRWADEARLTALTINFLALDDSGLTTMPFAECGKAMARGLGYAGEGDTLTAGLVGALRQAYHDTSFVEMFCPDWKEDTVLLSHMGEINYDLVQWKPILRSIRFSYNRLGKAAAAYGCYRPGQAVLVNVAPMKEGFSLIAAPVEMLGCGRETNVYRNAVQGWMKPDRPLSEFLKAYSELGGTHHSALVYGAQADEITAFGRMMGFETHVL